MSIIDAVYKVLPSFIQNVAISYYGYKIKKERFDSFFYDKYVLFNKSQYYSRIDLVHYQDEALCRLIKYAYENVPYYNRMFKKRKLKPSDIKNQMDLYKLPVITKKDIRENFDDFLSTKKRKKKLKVGHTSGTTGTPFEILWDSNIEGVNNAILWRHRSWGGFNFGHKYATLLGRTIIPSNRQRPPFHRINFPWNQYLFSSFHLADNNIGYYLEEFDKQEIRFLEAYPSTAYILAQYLEQHDLFYKMKAVFTSSETLLPVQRELIEKRFCCKVFDYYGSAERVMFSGECEKHEGHHLCLEYGITEILDEEGEPVSTGQYGKTVCTGLYNYGMPLIRYEIGDICSIQEKKCSCGRGLPLLGPITTKAEDIVVLPSGKLISSSVLTHPFKPLKNIEKSQIIQEDCDRIRVKLVKRPGYTENDTRTLVEGLAERLGQDIEISVEFVHDIAPGPNGKYRWVISRVPIVLGSGKIENLYNENNKGHVKEE